MKQFGKGIVLVLSLGTVGAAERSDTPLIKAVREGDVKMVSALLQRRADVNATMADGTTALQWAVHRNDVATVDRLIRAGAQVNATNVFGMSPLSMAAENASVAVVERLLEAGANPDTTLPGGETVLMTAARTGNPQVVKALLAHAANVNAREHTRDQTALMWAASEGNAAAVKLLIEARADINARSTELKTFFENKFTAGRKDADSKERLPMYTPLLFAVSGGHIEVAKALLDAGANVNDGTSDGTTALHIAVINAQWEMGVMLVERGGDVKLESPGGTALHHLARARAGKTLVRLGGLPPPVPTGKLTSIDLAKALLAHGADPNMRLTKPSLASYPPVPPQTSMTPLMMAMIPADPEYARVLLAAGADPKMLLGKRTTMLMLACGAGLNALLGDDEEALMNVKMLIDLGLDVNAQNDDLDTALHWAAFRNYIPLLQYLVDHGAKVDTPNKIGWTPLMEARWTARGVLNTRPEAEAFLRKVYTERGITPIVPTREEALERLHNSKGGPRISCPAGITVKAMDGKATVINYQAATATTSQQNAKLETTCKPSAGSVFPIGTTLVTCTAIDENKRSDSCTVLMRVIQ